MLRLKSVPVDNVLHSSLAKPCQSCSVYDKGELCMFGVYDRMHVDGAPADLALALMDTAVAQFA